MLWGTDYCHVSVLLAFTQIPHDLGREEEPHLTSLQLTLDASGPLLGRESWWSNILFLEDKARQCENVKFGHNV